MFDRVIYLNDKSYLFYYGKIWNGKKYPLANVKFDMENFYHLKFL